MLSNSAIIACGVAWGICAILLIITMVRVNRATRYFYVPADTQRPRTLPKVAPVTGGPAAKFGPLPRKGKPFHRQKSYGRKY